ncbi:MAG: beta-N-acetylglucosaminidase domain-containing protein [Alistipes sp.]|nr:beta-N-acetylglucosaminidase domain-containing protein [Alistipes sp.]
MKRTFKTILLTVAAALCTVTTNAQDLQSQRGESQDLGGLFGHKIDHGGLVINPTPQSITTYATESLDITHGVALKGKAKEFSAELSFLKQNKKGKTLTISYAHKGFAADSGVENKSGAYTLAIDNKGIAIEAYDSLGAFYAIQTLRQVVESPISTEGRLPSLRICDWPDLQYRGVVEGFYGTPWSHETRLSLIDTYGRYKMNYYVYGPKDDPYHSSPYWREEYPAEEAAEIKELVEACNRNRVNFVWAVHPGKDIKWEESDIQNLLRKFEAMYQLGVRAFAVHFDDIEGAGTNPYYQTELMNILNEDFVKVKGDVAPLIVCPTDYTRLWANPSERGSLVIYGNELDPSVDVFWTGDAVCSDMTPSTMEWIATRIKRPALFWWNYPVTDYARHIMMQGPVYGLSPILTSEETRGLVSNPMEHGEASKLALYSVADYTWNTEAYNPIDSWERGLESLAPEVKEAYRLFAIHSCDTETGYRRHESWETETFTMAEYDAEKAATLREELVRIAEVEEQMASMKNKALLAELQPWLVELTKLATRCLNALDCLELYRAGEYEAFWNLYVANIMSEADIAAFDAHRVGTMKLHPFYERLMDDMAAAYFESLTGTKSSTLSPIGTYISLGAPQAKYMFDNDPTTYYHSGQGQRTDDFVGVDLGIVREVREVRIIQGRNSVDDVDYFDHTIVEYSVDGETWEALTEPLKGVYDVVWTGEPFEARYVGIRKLESEKRNWLAIRAFEINPVTPEEYGADNNPYTALAIEGSTRITLPETTTSCTLLLGLLDADARYTLLTEEGNIVGEGNITTSHLHLDTTGAAYIDIYGVDRLFESVINK